MTIIHITPEQARRRCDPNSFLFETTAELPYTDDIFGQVRATRAIDFGINIDAPGFNVFVVGAAGTGRTSTIKHYLQRHAPGEAASSDWIYVHNFADAYRPRAISLPRGTARAFAEAIDAAINQIRTQLPAVFESEQYDNALDQIQQELNAAEVKTQEQARARAVKEKLVLARTASGYTVVPAYRGKPMSAARYAALPKRERARLEAAQRALIETVEDLGRQAREVERAASVKVMVLDGQVMEAIAGPVIAELTTRFASAGEAVGGYLTALQADLVAHVPMFKPARPAEGDAAAPIPETWFNRYRVNVFVADGASAGAPVIIEDNPSYFNLLGRVDRNSAGGNAAPTDHMMLRAGSLHRANGGFLVLRAADIYAHGEAWAGLKRCLLQGEIQLEDVAAQQMMVPTGAIEPYPMPLRVKVILMGNSTAYWAGYNDDEDFRTLFKVKAEFSSEMPRTPENERQYAQFVRARAEEEKLLPFDRTGVAALVEYGSRQLEDQHKISAQFGRLADLIREASYWAKRSQHAVVGAADVERAQTEKHFRLSLYEDLKRQQVSRGVYFLQTDGEVVGQINGLSVLDLDEYEFGEPTRITARSFVGRGGITDLDRANNYTDGSHNKGIGLIESYLNAQYSVEQALTLTANVAFEQSYNSHSGDSASCALLCAMLSAVSGLPIDQHIAMTGTLDQFGVVQPIGGAQTKIEGFFDICKERGLDGNHMVVMPARNIDDLMLRGDVVEAIQNGKFRVVAIEHVDEAIELAMGRPAGQRDSEGVFTPDSVHAIVEAVLKEINERLDGKHDKDKDKDGEKPAETKPEPPVAPPNAPDPHEPAGPGLSEG